jgi:hypothetical protein
MLALAHTPYQAVVFTVGFAGLEDDATVVAVWLLAGMPANVTLGTLPLLSVVVGPLPNPPSPSTRYPHLFIVRSDGEADVPVDAVMLFAPFTMELFVVLVVMVRL